MTAVLLGVLLAALVRGLLLHFENVFVSSESNRAVLAGAFASIAAGLAIPRGFAAWMARKAWLRFAQHTPSPEASTVLHQVDVADRPLRWLVLASFSMFVGLLALMLPAQVWAATWVYELTHSRFVWSELPLQVLEAVIAFGAGVLPLGLLGMTVSCVHHAFDRTGAWEPRATGFLLAGCAGGLFIPHVFATAGSSARPLVLGGALCAFVASLVCGLVAGAEPTTTPSPDLTTEGLPQWSDRRPRWLRGSVLILGLACASTLILGVTVSPSGVSPASTIVPMIVVLAAAAFLTGCFLQRRTVGSLAGFGCATIAAGVLSAVGAGFADAASTGSGFVFAAVLSSGSAAFATGYGWTTLLRRVAAGSSEGSKTATRLLIGSAACAWIVVPLLTRCAGVVEMFLFLSLVLTVTGGILVAQEPSILFRRRPNEPVAPMATP